MKVLKAASVGTANTLAVVLEHSHVEVDLKLSREVQTELGKLNDQLNSFKSVLDGLVQSSFPDDVKLLTSTKDQISVAHIFDRLYMQPKKD